MSSATTVLSMLSQTFDCTRAPCEIGAVYVVKDSSNALLGRETVLANNTSYNISLCFTQWSVYRTLFGVWPFCQSSDLKMYTSAPPMPILRIQTAESGSGTDFVWFVSCFSPHTGAIYLTDSSELNVMEGGNASFFNNHAGTSGGKNCHSCRPR